ncbi:MAG: 2-oxo-4-hydroxy-4-carboxy-5-ureidoimidazoline decarboxylase [Actinomycetota bacterium]
MMHLSDDELRDGLMASLAVPRWVDDVIAFSPFESFEALFSTASDAATPLSADEIQQAIADHPRIGEKPIGEGTAQEFSRAEQAGLRDDDGDLDEALRSGNEAYEERFGRVFIIRAAGRSKREILSELERRLDLPNSTELEIVGEQLRDIALLRIEKLWGRVE